MGAWGVYIFDNDDARDWVHTLKNSKGLDLLLTPINKIITTTEYLESPDCSEALAAAEVIRASIKNDVTKIPIEAEKWLEKKPGFFSKRPEILTSHASLAKQAVEKIIAGSELQELWEESDEYENWKVILNNLISELS